MRRDGSAWQVGARLAIRAVPHRYEPAAPRASHVPQHRTHVLAVAPVAASLRVLDRKHASAGGSLIRNGEPTKGFEPPTRALRKRCSTPELRRLAGSASISMGSGLDRAATDAAGPKHEHPHAGGYATRRKPSAPAATSSAQVEQTVCVAWQSSQKTWRPSTTKRPQKAHSASMARAGVLARACEAVARRLLTGRGPQRFGVGVEGIFSFWPT
jgi:hypothetical protein